MTANENNTFYLTGHHGVGKSFLCKMLEEQRGKVLHLECGETVRCLYNQSGSLLSYREWVKANVVSRGNDFLENDVTDVFKKRIAADEDSDVIIITGFRSPRHMNYVSEKLGIESPTIIFIDGVFELRKANYELREGVHITNDEFLELINHDIQMGLEEIRTHVMQNIGKCFLLTNLDNNSKNLFSQLLAILRRPHIGRCM